MHTILSASLLAASALCSHGAFAQSSILDRPMAKVRSVEEVNFFIEASTPPILIVSANGTVNTTGWSDAELAPYLYATPPADGIIDFDFVARTPERTSYQMQVITPISATASGFHLDWILGVRVHSATDSIEILFDETQASPIVAPLGGGDTLPWPWQIGNFTE